MTVSGWCPVSVLSFMSQALINLMVTSTYCWLHNVVSTVCVFAMGTIIGGSSSSSSRQHTPWASISRTTGHV
jgi:hypothetical protein